MDFLRYHALTNLGRQLKHTIITRDRALNVQAYRDSGIIAKVDSLAEDRHSERLAPFEPRSFVKPFDAMAVHWRVERSDESSSDGKET